MTNPLDALKAKMSQDDFLAGLTVDNPTTAKEAIWMVFEVLESQAREIEDLRRRMDDNDRNRPTLFTAGG